MAIARSPRSTWKYVLLADRKLPREQQTVWKLKHLSLEDEHRLLDNLVRDPVTGLAVRAMPGSEHLRSLRIGLDGWENLRDADGTLVACEKDGKDESGFVKDSCLFRIPLADREELARAIENELVFDPDEVGKS